MSSPDCKSKQDIKGIHRKKKIAPVVITIIMLIYFTGYFGLLIWIISITWVKILLGFIPLLLGAGMIGVCLQRIKEIDGGEEDDLSKY